jgi:hypothetical protein
MPTLSFLGRFFSAALLFLAVSVRAETTTEPKPAPAVEAKPETLVDDAGRFVVSLPKPVQHGTQSLDTAVGKIALKMTYYDGGATAYMVFYCDYPAGHVARAGGPDKIYASASNGAVQNWGGKIQSSSACQLGDVKGLEIVTNIPASKSIGRVRYFVVGDRLYQVMYVGPAGTETNPKAVKFLNSFRLTR